VRAVRLYYLRSRKKALRERRFRINTARYGHLILHVAEDQVVPGSIRSVCFGVAGSNSGVLKDWSQILPVMHTLPVATAPWQLIAMGNALAGPPSECGLVAFPDDGHGGRYAAAIGADEARDRIRSGWTPARCWNHDGRRCRAGRTRGSS
jgi:hypothetical protein